MSKIITEAHIVRIRPRIYSFLYIVGVLTFAVIPLSACSSDPDNEELLEEQNIKENETAVEMACTRGKLFVEKDGLVRIDIENPSLVANGWSTATALQGYEGAGYLIWTGEDSFNEPGQGLISFSIKISTPGTYQFVWSSRIGAGTSNTEHNDSWLRIKANDFFGEKASTGERVYPKGSGKTPNPEGSSKDGWLKAYMNRVGEWFYRSSTNDKDPFDIYATFDQAGTYEVEISGRSKSHAIDQFVLFRTDKTLEQAITSRLSEINCK
ncbi:MAG: hypothetical protein WBN50_13495 [Lutimonas sp.]